VDGTSFDHFNIINNEVMLKSSSLSLLFSKTELIGIVCEGALSSVRHLSISSVESLSCVCFVEDNGVEVNIARGQTMGMDSDLNPLLKRSGSFIFIAVKSNKKFVVFDRKLIDCFFVFVLHSKDVVMFNISVRDKVEPK